ncbi:MAG: cation diffusion facilitator family transporter [Streptosporangiaceae bacterium]
MTDCGTGHPESGERQHTHAGAGEDHDHGGHGHGVTADSDSRYLVIALGLILAFLVFEVVMAFAGHSLALLADAGHMLTDAGALAASLLALRLARRPASGMWTFGFKRAEVLSAQANGITLLVISALVASGAISRLLHPLPVRGGIVVAVAAAGVAVNVAATWVLAKANRDSINVRGASAHIITDLYGFIGTLAAGIVIIVTGFERADAIASLIVVGLMLHAAWGLLRQTGRILLEAAPEGYAPGDIIAAIMSRPEVASVHDVHVWLITSGFPALSAHVLVRRPADCHQARRDLEQLLCDRFGLDHTTLQVDHAPDELLSIGSDQR